MKKKKNTAKTNIETKLATKIFSYVFLGLLALVCIFPLTVLLCGAFKPGNTLSFTLDLTNNWTLENFGRLFSETQYGNWFKNTFIIAIIQTVVQVTVLTLMAYAFSRYRFVGRKYSLFGIMIIQMIPTFAALAAFYAIANIIGGLNQYWYLALIYIGGGIPMNTWLFKGYFDSVPIDLDEAARVDGAGSLRILVQILLPLVRPMLALQALWAFMGPWQEYMVAKFLLTNESNYTVAVGLQQFISDAHNQRIVLFASGSLLIALPSAILFYMLQKNFVSGLLSGGTKG
jgi:arabinogalactan oligomer/maltooligosaccharide transport system permease protein